MPFLARIRVDNVPAAHSLAGYPGPCARLHGHNWGFEAVVAADRLDQDMVVDFAVVKDVFRELDHTNLDDDQEITAEGHRPTSERLAVVLADRLQRRLDALPHRPRLVEITVRESARNEVVYRPCTGT
jgi:6-pyruvoyltetrahydropterin/6-carboxytetrahydropterin synthase